MLLVGLTGNIASGKSTVAARFVELAATLIDADRLARQAVEVGTPAYQAIVRRWGSGVVAPDGTLERGALRHRVFEDAHELEELNAIVHPEVSRLRDDEIGAARARGDRLVVCDIPLLFERRLAEMFDRIVLVDAPRPVRLERLTRERDLSETEAMNMIAAQMPAELKRARADYIIENDGSVEQLVRRTDDVYAALERQAGAREKSIARG